MDKLTANITTGKMARLTGQRGAPVKKETGSLPQDGFTRSVNTDIPTKPVFKSTSTPPAGSLMALTSPLVGSTVAAAAPGSPLFGSISGALAKWLISTEEEVKIGRMIKGNVESSNALSNDPAMNARVNNLGQGIAANSSRKDINYEFKVIDDDTVNAFACPGGFIYVHRGLLEQFPDDAHLAFILGHEVGHVEHRDSIDKLGTNFMLQIIQQALGATQGKLDDMLGAATGMLYDTALSRKAEYKADRRGAEHMELLGFNPAEGAAALRGLEKAGQSKPHILEKLLSTHPPTEERASRVEKYAAKKGF